MLVRYFNSSTRDKRLTMNLIFIIIFGVLFTSLIFSVGGFIKALYKEGYSKVAALLIAAITGFSVAFLIVKD